MVIAKNAKELVGLAHTNTLAALGNADPNQTELCYGLINNLFQILRLEDFYADLAMLQDGVVAELISEPQVDETATCDNVITFPAPEPEPEPEQMAATPCVRTRDEVRALLVQVSKANKDLKSLLDKYGATKFSDLAESAYDAVYAEAEALMSEG